MSARAFNPCGPTINVDGATSAPSGIQASSNVTATAYRIYNAGASVAWVAFGIDAATAQANAVIPTGGGANAKDSYAIPVGAVDIISAPHNTYWSARTASGTAEVYITPGRGV